MININGKHLKPLLAKEARRLGCKTLEKCAIAGLLTSDGQVIGAVGFNIRKGTFYIIKAKSTILATGNTNRIFENPTGMPFNTWQCPANTGAAQTMAFEAGAQLAKIVNAAGEEFMLKYHPLGNRAARSKLVEGVMKEISEGRGPIYVDCRHLSKKDMTHLYKTLGYDKDTLPDFIEQKGMDLRKDRLELMASEGMQGGPSDICTTGGYLAGKVAAEYSHELKDRSVSLSQVKEMKARTFAPLRASGALSHRKFEDTMRKMLWLYAGPARNENTLNLALEKLEQLEKHYGEILAQNYHELMRVSEAYQIMQVGKMMCHASLARKETRFNVYHHRTDFPETNPEFDGQIVVQKTKKGMKTSLKKLDYVTMPGK
jgi:adenylylsulfate reductase subunit A